MTAAATHEVFNQPGELAGYNLFTTDAALAAAVTTFGGGWGASHLAGIGARLGSAETQALAREAEQRPPRLRTHDRFGHRLDEVDYGPAWHSLMARFRADGAHALGWTDPRPGAHVVRAAAAYLWAQAEPGVGCPGVMTFASIAALRHAPALLAAYQDKILSPAYDPRALPPRDKTALAVAMAMTEKQSGSDLRQTQTVATPLSGDLHALTGHKWFFSAPMSDLFLTLARTPAGISCFLAQGWRDDGRRNHLQLQRLKDKCGNRANASSEVEFRGLEARLVGPEGRGIATIIEMAHLTRIECALGSAALMRNATLQALHHATHRTAFERRLAAQPLMENVLADLVLESEAATWLALRAAAALDAAERDPGARALSRLLAPIAKYWVCKRAPPVAAEALEVQGGNGFIEEHIAARHYRDAPLNGLWEGSGNVICLDVLRALSRGPQAAEALTSEIAQARGLHPALDAVLAAGWEQPSEAGARRLTETLATALCASLLLRHAPPALAEAYCRTRLTATHGAAFGTLPEGLDGAAIIARALPA